MAFKASFKFSDSKEFDVLRWDVEFNRDTDPKGRPASDIYGGTINVEVESTPDTIVLDKMFKQYQPVNGSIVFKKADDLTSSSCHPKIFVKEFSYFLMSCH